MNLCPDEWPRETPPAPKDWAKDFYSPAALLEWVLAQEYCRFSEYEYESAAKKLLSGKGKIITDPYANDRSWQVVLFPKKEKEKEKEKKER